MTIIDQLKSELEQAKLDKEQIVAPYNARIKYLENAIKSLQGFVDKTTFINNRGEEKVNTLD